MIRGLRRERRLLRAFARLEDDEIAASPGTVEQHALQRLDAQQAAGQAGADDWQAGGAEELGDGGEAERDGAAFQGQGEMTAIDEQDVEDGEDVGDLRRHGPAALLGRSGRRR